MKQQRIKLSGAFLSLALFFLQPLAAQDNAGLVTANATARHSLWKVEGGSHVVYLLGSIHLLKPDDFPLAAPLESAFSNAQVAVFESDVEKMEDPEVQQKMLSKSQLPAGETLQQHLSAATYSAFTNQVNESGLPLAIFESMRPAVAAMTLGLIEVAKQGADPQNGLDKYFADKAVKDGKQVIGLETMDFQIDLLTSFSPSEEEIVMKETLRDIDKTKHQFGAIMTAWRTGDGAAIEKLLNDDLKDVPAIYKRMVTDRNKSWAPKIEELLSGDKNAVVIVGVAHLVGDEGVVEMLKKKGYKVTQL
jgi:uncharacterized protein YbaP (TraB family)